MEVRRSELGSSSSNNSSNNSSSASIGDGTAQNPRVALNEATARAISTAAESDTDIANAVRSGLHLCSKPVTYTDVDGTILHGHLMWPDNAADERPGILMIHTAVGPHDLFMHWRCKSLAALGYVVLNVDCFGDDAGHAWDPEWSHAVRAPLCTDRKRLHSRLAAAASTLMAEPRVDSSNLAAVGFCFGGMAALDCARAGVAAGHLKAIVSFHGVLDAGPLADSVDLSSGPRIVMLHGDQDPFVPPEALTACLEQLREAGAPWELHCYGGVRHGFSNPAQALNESSSFGYNQVIADRSWVTLKAVLLEALSRE